MTLSQKKYKAKKLNLYDMWELYTLVGKSKKQKYLIDEIIHILQESSGENIRKAINLLYGYIPTNPLIYGLMVVKGLKSNNFFDFQDFMEKLDGSSR